MAQPNRHECQFPNPDVLDSGRNPEDHSGFGFGINYCIGAALARLEVKLAMRRCGVASRTFK
jgi:cytochrome P450